MTKRSRQIYVIVAIITWLVALPILWLYASGYRLNVQDFSVDKTGSIQLRTYPRDARIYINDELNSKRTPALIQNLTPDEYAIRIESATGGYWSATVDIKEGTTSDFYDILLLTDSHTPEELPDGYSLDAQKTVTSLPPELQRTLNNNGIDSDADLIEISAEHQLIIDTDGVLYNLQKDGTQYRVSQVASNVISADWDPINSLVVYSTGFEILISDLSSSRTLLRRSSYIPSVLWHPRGGYVVYATNNSISIIEQRLTDSPNTYEVYVGDSVKKLHLDELGNTLYFTDTETAYSLTLF